MLEQLQSAQGKKLTLELVNGRKITGTVAGVNLHCVRMETDEGTGTIPVSAIQVVWEPTTRSLTEEKMEYIAEKLRSEEPNRINCTAAPGFTCANQYVCIPPDNCVYTFACPGVYTPNEPQGGCPYFQFYQPCGFYFNQPCSYSFYQPCTYNVYPPCSYNFYQPCGFRFYFQPCGYQFNQPCYFQFQQPCTYRFGSQCTTPGGFTCPGQAFYGLTSLAAKEEGTKKDGGK